MVFDSFLSVGSVNVLVGGVGLVFGLLLVGFEFWFWVFGFNFGLVFAMLAFGVLVLLC